MKELIDKSEVIAEIEKVIDEPAPSHDQQCPWEDGYYCGLYKAESIIDTIEVKEVNLDFPTFAKEMDAIFVLPSSETKNTEENPLNWEYAIAKHFFELGIKSKGECI